MRRFRAFPPRSSCWKSRTPGRAFLVKYRTGCSIRSSAPNPTAQDWACRLRLVLLTSMEALWSLRPSLVAAQLFACCCQLVMIKVRMRKHAKILLVEDDV